MAELTDAQKARIRAEEEARAQALLEARYREQVRAEVEAASGLPADPVPEAPAPPASAPPPRGTSPPAPSPEALPRGPRANVRVALWSLVALLGLGGVALTTWGIARAVGGGGRGAAESLADDPADVEVVAAATGPIAAAPEARWDAADLGFTGYELGPDGALREVTRPGASTRDELARELIAHETVAGRGPAPAPSTTLAELEARAAVSNEADPLLRWVPPDAFVVAGLDLAEARRTPALARLRDGLLELLGVRRSVASLDDVLGLDLLGRGGLAVFAFSEAALREGGDERLVLARVPYDADGVARRLRGVDPAAVPRRTADGLVTRFGEGGVVLGDGFVLVAAPRSFEAAIKARSGTSALVTGALSAPLREARVAPHAFAAMRWPAGPRDGLPAELAALAEVDSVRLRVVVRGARVRIEVAARLEDEASASRLLGLLTAQRRGPAAPLLADVTLAREEHAVMARATFGDEGLRRWLAAARAVW